MARAIPTYERRVIADGIQSAPSASSSVSASSPVGQGLANLGSSMGSLAGVLRAEEIEKQDNRAAVDVSNVLSQGDVYWQEQGTRAMQNWKVGDPDIRETIGGQFDKWINDSEAKLPTDKARQYFRKQAVSMKSRLQQNAFSFQERATTSKLNADSDAGMQADENVVFQDAGRVDEVYARRVEPLLARTDLTEAEKITAANKFKRGLFLAAERGEMERDPAGWYRKRFGEFNPNAPAGAAPSAPGAAVVPAGGSVAIAEAIYGQESSSGRADTSRVNSQNVTGPMQVQQGTFEGMKRQGIIPQNYDWRNPEHNKDAGFKWVDYLSGKYNGDAAKVAAAYYGGEKAVAADGTIKRGMKNLQRPSDPTVGEYVDQVLARIRKNSPPGGVQVAAASTGTASDAGNGMPAVVPQPPKTFGGIEYEQQLALKSMAETKLKQQSTVLRAQTESVVRDATAMHRDGIVDPVQLKPEQFSVFGAEGPRMYEEYQKSRQMGADIGMFKTQSEAEIQASLNATQPQPGEGYATADARQGIRVQAAQQVLQMRNADPAGYVVKNSDSLKKQRAMLDDPATPAEQRPALVQKFVAESIAEQQRLGIARPKVLTPGQADAIAQRAMTSGKPEDAANLIGGLEAEYGRFFPQVFEQLVAEKKIAGELLIIPNLPSPAARELVSRLARVKEADLVQGLSSDAQKTVKDETVAVLGEFSKTIPFMTEQAAGTVNAYETTMRKLAYQFVQTGMDPSKAADQAREMLLGHYTFEDTARIPRGVDASKVLRGGKFMLSNDLVGIDVPPDVVGGRTPEQAALMWRETVQARPQWYTSQDDGGLQLFAVGANGVRYRVTRGGKPVAYDWADLAGRVSVNSGRVSTGKIQDMTGTR